MKTELRWEDRIGRIAPVLLRLALGLTFLSAVGDRLGLWGPYGSDHVSWGDWQHFVAYTARVNSFLPASWAASLGVMATAAEIILGVALIFGIFLRWTALASAFLLFGFGLAMTLSFGIKAPLDYSVFVDATAALLLSALSFRKTGAQV